MKKIAFGLILICLFSGCGSKANIDELISAKELPEYSKNVDIQISEGEENNNSDVIVIE